MNQILAVEIEKKKEHKKTSIKSIVVVFCIILIIFGISITSTGGYNLYTGLKEKGLAQYEASELSITMDRVSANVSKIVVTNEIGISKVSYKINNNDEIQIDGNKQTRVQKEIELEAGKSTITISAEDIKGRKKTEEFSVEVEEGPKISLEQQENQIQITVESSKIVDTVKYYWDKDESDGKEFTINAEKNVTNVEYKGGTHTLNVIAKDKEGHETKRSQDLIVYIKPSIEITTDGQNFFVKVVCEEGLSKIEITLNSNDTIVEQTTETEYSKTIPVENGENKLKVKAYNKSNFSEVKGVKFTK